MHPQNWKKEMCTSAVNKESRYDVRNIRDRSWLAPVLPASSFEKRPERPKYRAESQTFNIEHSNNASTY